MGDDHTSKEALLMCTPPKTKQLRVLIEQYKKALEENRYLQNEKLRLLEELVSLQENKSSSH